jgi:hypothetical protein
MKPRGESFEEIERKWREHRMPPLAIGITGDLYVTDRRDRLPPLRSYGARERVLAGIRDAERRKK